MKSVDLFIRENKAAHSRWAACGGTERCACGLSLTQEQQQASDAMEASDMELLWARQNAKKFGIVGAELTKLEKQLR